MVIPQEVATESTENSSKKFCTVCNAEIVQNLGNEEEEEEKEKKRNFVQIFLQCVSIEGDRIKGDLDGVAFCFNCKLNLDEWEYDQEQIGKLIQRSRVLRATLLRKLLEFGKKWELTRDDRDKADAVQEEIRQLVLNEYNPRVRLNRLTTDEISALSGKKLNKNVKKKHGGSKIVGSKCNNLQKILAAPAVVKTGRGDYIYRDRVPFSYRLRKYHCGFCQTVCMPSPDGFGWRYIVKHIRNKHKAELEATPVVSDITADEVPIAEEQAEDNNNDDNDSNNNPNSGLFDGGLWSTFAAGVAEDNNEEEKGEDQEMMNVSMDSSGVEENLDDKGNDDENSFTEGFAEDAGNDDENSYPDGFIDAASSLLQVELDIPEELTFPEVPETDGVVVNERRSSFSIDENIEPDENSVFPRFTGLAVTVVGPGKYIYRNKVPFTYVGGKFICGLCGKTSGGVIRNAQQNMYKHIRTKHSDAKLIQEGVEPLVEMSKQISEMQSTLSAKALEEGSSSPLVKMLSTEPLIESPEIVSAVAEKTSPPSPSKAPRFASSRVHQVTPGKYIYRGKVPFSFSKGRFTCGSCFKIFDGNSIIAKHQLLSHMRVKHLSGSTSDNKSRTTVSTTPSSNKLREQPVQQPGRPLYKGKVPYAVRRNAFYCGVCPVMCKNPLSPLQAKEDLFAHIERAHAAMLEDLPDIRIRNDASIFCTEDDDNVQQQVPSRLHPALLGVEPSKKLPTESPVVRRTAPGRFLYRETVPFFISDGRHHCGMCKSSYKCVSATDARANLLKHMRKRHLPKNAIPKKVPVDMNNLTVAAVTAPSPTPAARTEEQQQQAAIASQMGQLVHTEVQEISPGRFIFQGKPFWYIDGKYRCGLCPMFWPASVGAGIVLLHLKTTHASTTFPSDSGAEMTAKIVGEVPNGPATDDIDSDQLPQIQNCFSLSTASCASSDDNTSIPQPSDNSEPVPNFPLSRVQQVGPGNYIYRNRVPFSFANGSFACGVCTQTYGGNLLIAKHQMLSHLRVKHTGAATISTEPSSNMNTNSGTNPVSDPPTEVPTAVSSKPESIPDTTPTFRSSDVRETHPGQYSYRGAVPFSYMDGKFNCGLCPFAYLGTVNNSKQIILKHITAHWIERTTEKSNPTSESVLTAPQNQQASQLRNPPALIPADPLIEAPNTVPSNSSLIHTLEQFINNADGTQASQKIWHPQIPSSPTFIRTSSPVAALPVRTSPAPGALPIRTSSPGTSGFQSRVSPASVRSSPLPHSAVPTQPPNRASMGPYAQQPQIRTYSPGMVQAPATPCYQSTAQTMLSPQPSYSNNMYHTNPVPQPPYGNNIYHANPVPQPNYANPVPQPNYANQVPQPTSRYYLPPEVHELGFGKYMYRNKMFMLINSGHFVCSLCQQRWMGVRESWEMILAHMRTAHEANDSGAQPMGNYYSPMGSTASMTQNSLPTSSMPSHANPANALPSFNQQNYAPYPSVAQPFVNSTAAMSGFSPVPTHHGMSFNGTSQANNNAGMTTDPYSTGTLPAFSQLRSTIPTNIVPNPQSYESIKPEPS